MEPKKISQIKLKFLWIASSLGLALAILSLWLPWAVVEVQPDEFNQPDKTSYIFDDDIPQYAPDKVSIVYWSSESQERFFQTAAKVVEWRWLVAIPSLFSLYYLYLHVLKLPSGGCLGTIIIWGFVQLLISFPEWFRNLLRPDIAISSLIGIHINKFALCWPMIIVVTISAILGVVSAYGCRRSQLHLNK